MALITAKEVEKYIAEFAASDRLQMRVRVDANLYLLLKRGRPWPSGKKPKVSAYWLMRYGSGRERSDMSLGVFPEVGLGDARARAAVEQAKRKDGVDPLQARRAAKEAKRQQTQAAKVAAVTVRDACEAVIEAKTPGLSNAKHRAQWGSTLSTYVYPKIGDRPVAAITVEDALAVLTPIWNRIPETAGRVRQRMEAAFDLAKTRGWRSGDNPWVWRGNLSNVLPAAKRVRPVQHHPALPWQQMPAFMAALTKAQGISAKALRFAILTAARSGEVRGAKWREVDFEGRVWIIPAARMKAKVQHRVPLSDAAIAILEALKPEKPHPDGWVFVSATGSMLSDMALSMLVRGMACDGLEEGELPRWRDDEGNAVVPHGFRSTFRDWAGETRGDGHDVVERALAHTIKNQAEAAYARSDLMEKRRTLMAAWAEHCAPADKGPVVVSLMAGAR